MRRLAHVRTGSDRPCRRPTARLPAVKARPACTTPLAAKEARTASPLTSPPLPVEIEDGLHEPPRRVRRETEPQHDEQHRAEALGADRPDGAVRVGGAPAEAGGGARGQGADEDVHERRAPRSPNRARRSIHGRTAGVERDGHGSMTIVPSGVGAAAAGTPFTRSGIDSESPAMSGTPAAPDAFPPAVESAPLVEFRDLTVSYGPLVALSGVTGAFPPGPTGLLGPNGAGKTTLLKTLLGFLKPDARAHRRLRPRSRALAPRGAAAHRLHAGGGLPRPVA